MATLHQRVTTRPALLVTTRLDQLQSVLRIRWVDQDRRVDLEFQGEVNLVGLPTVGDEFVIPVSHAGNRAVTAVVKLEGHLPIVVLSTIHADAELPPQIRDHPKMQMRGWHVGFIDTASSHQ